MYFVLKYRGFDNNFLYFSNYEIVVTSQHPLPKNSTVETSFPPIRPIACADWLIQTKSGSPDVFERPTINKTQILRAFLIIIYCYCSFPYASS